MTASIAVGDSFVHSSSAHVAARSIQAVHVNVSVWRRRLPGELLAALRESPPPFAFEAELRGEGPPLVAALDTLRAPARALLERDVDMLTRYFVALTGARRVRFNFSVLRDDRCRKFHVDYLPLRLVTTYSGPGTEWLPDDAVHRPALMGSPECADAANAGIVRDGRRVHRARPGDVLLLKGVHYTGSASGAAVHRSPPIEAIGATRVVLTLTALEAVHPFRTAPPPPSRERARQEVRA